MKIKVISGYVSHKGEVLGIGAVIDDIDSSNAERLCNDGLCELLSGASTDNSTDETDREKDLDEMTKAELIAYADDIGVKVDEKAKKADIIATIMNADRPATDFPQ